MTRRVLAAVFAIGLLAASCADDRSRATDREQQTESASVSESESESSGDRVAHYERVVDELPDPESVTVLVVAGATREEVARELDVDLTEPVDEDDIWSSDGTGWPCSTSRAASSPWSPRGTATRPWPL